MMSITKNIRTGAFSAAKLADKDRDILYANLQLSQKEQNETLIDVLRPVSRPAYITCSPYTSVNSYCANGYSGGCGA